MAIIKCKMCGGDLALTEGSTIAVCEFCGTRQTVPSMDDEKKLILFERAERLRRNCEFDKAASVYESIVADFRQEAEAYWGLVLCKYGIEYVDDPATGKKIPTCHRSSFESIMEDKDFEQVLENADPAARKVYREEAKQIEEIRRGIVAVSNNEAPYDIFICYKETAEDGQRTVDSVMAQDVYDALTDKGYRVFFSRVSLEDKLGQEYEPYIFAALNSAKVMLAIGTDYEYFNAVWVKNEWSRYLKLMEKDKSKHLIPCFKGIDAYDMPKEFSKLQAQDLGKVGAVQDLLRGIDKLIAAKPAPQVTAGVQTDDVNRIYLYNSALDGIRSKKIKTIQDAIGKLESLGNWNDAPAQLEKAKQQLKKRKSARMVRRIISLVLVLAIVGGIAGLVMYEDYSNKKARYNSAVNFMNAGDYQNAYNYFVKAEDYQDAPEMAEKVLEMMETYGAEIIATAEDLAGKGFYMTAGFYLMEKTSQMNSLSSDAIQQIDELISNYTMMGEEQYAAWFETAESTTDGDMMAELFSMLEYAAAAGDFTQVLEMIQKYELTNNYGGEEVFLNAINSGMLDNVTLDELIEYCPDMIPVMDCHIGQSGYALDLVEE